MAKQNVFSLHLAKPEVTNFDDLLTDTARGLVKSNPANKTRSDQFGDGGTLFIFPGIRQDPKWVPLLKPEFSISDNVKSLSPCALLAFKKAEFIFALTFSFAHVYLDDSKTEADFGLKVAINYVSDQKLRSVERSNIGAAIRDFAQAAGQRDLRSFGFDDALDLIRKVSGYADSEDDNEFADMVTGSRTLRFSKAIDIADVPQTALEAVKLFKSKAYKKTAFKVIDFLSPVLDPVVRSNLDDELAKAIREGSDEFEIGIPDILPETIASFRFEHAGIRDFYPDLSLELYREGLGERLAKLTMEDLKKHVVAGYSTENDRPFKRWTILRSLVGSLALKNERFALSEGNWYRIGQAFKEAADKRFVELSGKPDPKLRPLKKMVYQSKEKRKKKTVSYQSEESYNKEIADETNYLLMDQKLIQIDEIPGPGIEACDLLDIEGRRFIHVKKSSRQSSVLSHFFKQGGNSAQMIKKYEPFKSGLIEKVKQDYGQERANKLRAALKDRWTVDFQIADFPRHDGTHNIPFFSKLTLREEARNMQAMDFDVNVSFISLARIKKASPKAKK